MQSLDILYNNNNKKENFSSCDFPSTTIKKTQQFPITLGNYINNSYNFISHIVISKETLEIPTRSIKINKIFEH